MNVRIQALGLITALGAVAAPVEYRVGAVGGTYSNLQAAIDACPTQGCRILLTDSAYRFGEPVNICAKANLEIVGASPNGVPPVLGLEPSALELDDMPSLAGNSPAKVFPVLWQDAPPDTIANLDGSRTIRAKKAVLGASGKAARFFLTPGRNSAGQLDPQRPSGWMLGPFEEKSWSLTPYHGHLFPALLLIENSRNIKISNLRFDGGAPTGFVINKLWGDMYSQYAGIAAISSNSSLQTEIGHCKFSGWFEAIRLFDPNSGGLVSDLMNSEPQEAMFTSSALRPLANPAAMGGHRIESNLAHHNLLFLNLVQSWDLASSVRFNRVWENGDTRLLTESGREALETGESIRYPGGFVRMEDVVYPPNIFQGNTLFRNSIDLGWSGFRASSGQLFIDNLSQRPKENPDWRELSYLLGKNCRNNWIAKQNRTTSAQGAVNDSVVPFCNNARCNPLTPAWGAAITDKMVVGQGYMGDDLGATWQNGRASEMIRLQDQTLGMVSKIDNGWRVTLPVPVEKSASVSGMRVVQARAQQIGILGNSMVSNVSAKTGLSELIQLAMDSGIDVLANSPLLKLPPVIDVSGLKDRALEPGVNLVTFDLPANATDSIWRVEFAVQGIDENTGKTVHSNLGVWLVRPLGKQLDVRVADSGAILPGQNVHFVVDVRDSLGQSADLDTLPKLNALGWKLDTTNSGKSIAGRKHSTTGRFQFTATAPASEGVSQVVFWSVEKGRIPAIAGAVYVDVGARATGIARRPSGLSKDGACHITWIGARKVLVLQDLPPSSVDRISLLDAQGRRLNTALSTQGNQTLLSLPLVKAGTYFLRIGDETRSLPLIP